MKEKVTYKMVKSARYPISVGIVPCILFVPRDLIALSEVKEREGWSEGGVLWVVFERKVCSSREYTQDVQIS